MVVRELTAEEKASEELRQAWIKANAESAALLLKANKLVDKIEELCEKRGGGVSGNYGLDEQYTVAGTWSKVEASMALNRWRSRFPDHVALGMHKLGPSEKTTGGRDHIWQFNFIRKMTTATNSRFNIHVNWNGKD